MLFENRLYRLKCMILFRLAMIFKKDCIIFDDKRHCGKSYLINKLSKKYKYEILKGNDLDVGTQIEKQFRYHLFKHNLTLLVDCYYHNQAEINYIRTIISNLKTYNDNFIGFITYCGPKTPKKKEM